MTGTISPSLSRTFAAIRREFNGIRNRLGSKDTAMIMHHLQAAEALVDDLEQQVGEDDTMEQTDISKAGQGARLRLARQALGLAVSTIADELGCSPSRWANWESGVAGMDTGIAIKLKDRYGVSLDWIFAGDTAGLPAELASGIVRGAA